MKAQNDLYLEVRLGYDLVVALPINKGTELLELIGQGYVLEGYGKDKKVVDMPNIDITLSSLKKIQEYQTKALLKEEN